MVLIRCISRSRGQKVGFQNAIFKYLLVWNYKAQSFHIWYIITSSRSSLPIFGYYNIMASFWPLTFSSGERPRALWALLLTVICRFTLLFNTPAFNQCDRVSVSFIENLTGFVQVLESPWIWFFSLKSP